MQMPLLIRAHNVYHGYGNNRFWGCRPKNGYKKRQKKGKHARHSTKINMNKHRLNSQYCGVKNEFCIVLDTSRYSLAYAERTPVVYISCPAITYGGTPFMNIFILDIQ